VLEVIVVGAGVLLGVGVLIMIFKGVEVSTGHSVIMGLAAALFCLPFVANFEWTKDGFKLTTKEVALELTGQVKQLAQEQVLLNENMKALNSVLEETSTQIAAIQEVLKSDKSRPGAELLKPTADPDKFLDLKEKFDRAMQNNNASADRLETLQKTIAKDWDGPHILNLMQPQ
jgi:hypothetical protein